MKKIGGIVRILFFGIIAIVAVGLLPDVLEAGPKKPTPEQRAAKSSLKANFIQREWMGRPERVLHPCSNVGAVEFTFRRKAGDVLFEHNGGGWLNVVTDTTAAQGTRQWAVQNLYLTYRNSDELVGSRPVVDFSLGLDGETCIKSLRAAVFLSSQPFEAQPESARLFRKKVDLVPYLVGGRLEGGNALSDIPFTIGPWIGPIFVPDRTAGISIALADVVEIDEGHMGCAPGAAARSISYLGETNDFETDDPQDIYDDLVDEMDTQISSTGTTDENMLDGKDSYTDDNDLDIDSEIVYTDTFDPVGGSSWEDLAEQVQDALDDGCDVEILISWSGGGGHVGMVTSVTSHADGSATIHYVDDPTQGDGMAENQEHVIGTDDTGAFGTGTVDGFMIECPSP